ncbi:MAG: hypothetical protein NC210_02725 [[Clostridium] fimetarium]|nr:hypothetical protein [Alistipes timonensis]MCM1405317.1 hypothetical protein [[Clostridium] fimetarium]
MKYVYILSIYLSAIIGMAITTGCSHVLEFDEPEFDVDVAFGISDIKFAADGTFRPLLNAGNTQSSYYITISPTFSQYECRIEYPEWMEIRAYRDSHTVIESGKWKSQNTFYASCKANSSIHQREGEVTITVRNTATSEISRTKRRNDIPVYTFTKTVKVIQQGATTE